MTRADLTRPHRTTRRRRTASLRAVLSASACAAALIAGVTGCAGIERDDPATAPNLSGRRAASTPTPTPVAAASLQGDYAELMRRLDRPVAVAWAPVGHPDQVQTLGTPPDDSDAWSTIKAPIALATSQRYGGAMPQQVRERMRLMITESDNASAARLYHALDPDDDDDAVLRDVLRSTGDATTRPARDAKGQDVPFGLTSWKLPDAARFASMLPCAKDSGPVLELMGELTEEHRWGVAHLSGGAAKGGWGPSDHGYLVRQIGVLPRPGGGRIAVALITQRPDGVHEKATAALDATATWLGSRLGDADAGTCPAPTAS